MKAVQVKSSAQYMIDSIFLGTNVVPYIKYVFPNHLFDYLVHVCSYYVSVGRNFFLHASEANSLLTVPFLNSEMSFHDAKMQCPT